MPFPYVAVTLPDDTPPAYVAGLLSACSQAYPEGNCRRDPDSSLPTATDESAESGRTVTRPAQTADTHGDTPTHANTSDAAPQREAVILANITWLDPTTATVLLGLPHWRNHRWIERSVSFKEQDQPLERYRALGFTIGSLAVTVGEVARLEQEARESEPAVATDSPSAATTPPPKPAPAAPTATLRIEDVPVGSGAHAPEEPWEPSVVVVRGYLAGELGEGFDTVRRGGSVGLGLFSRRWGGRVQGYYTDASSNGLEAAFSGVELSADLRLDWQVLEANLCIGGGYGHLSAQVDKQTSQVFPSGLVALNIMPARWTLAPYLGFGTRIFRGFDTDVPGLDSLGPVTPFVQLGLTLRTPDDSSETKP